MAKSEYDIAIIGAGAAGLGAACFLSEHRDVVVLEREDQPAYHSSGRSAALYIEGYENGVVADLTIRSGTFFKQPPPFAQHPLLHPRGGLTVATHGEEATMRAYLQRWEPLCPQLQSIDAEQTLNLVPAIREEWLTAAAYDPTWLSIDVHELLSTYQRGLKHHGGELICDATVNSLSFDGMWHIETTAGTVRANIVVNAAGAWAGEIATLAGAVPIDLTPMRRTAALIPPPDGCEQWPLVHTMAETLYFKPESPGLMVCPQDETPSEPTDAFAEELDVAKAMAQLEAVTTISVQRVLRQWAGLRTFAPDRRPVVGFDRSAKQFFWLAGQGGFGIQTSPGLGQLVCDNIVNAAPLPGAIQADRF